MPHWVMVVIGWTLGTGVLGAMIVWGLVWFRVEMSHATIPTLRRGQRLAGQTPPRGRVCVVVPAHNESRVIEGLVRSLKAETYPELRVVLALDRCTDDTAAIARRAVGDDDRFEIVEVTVCPEGWAGKVHAVHSGVAQSNAARDAEMLLFADADTLFEPGCVAAAVAMMRDRQVEFLSLISTLTCDKWFERVAQLAAGFELIRQYPLTRANASKDRRAFANGQFMLFSRAAYERVGGHESVKDAILEDLALAKRADELGVSIGVFFADGLFRCRMYADWAQFRRGWKRIYIEAANRKPDRLASAAWRTRWLGTLLPAAMFVAIPFALWVRPFDAPMGWTLLGMCGVALVLWLGALLRMTWFAHAPLWTAPLHVVGAWLVASILSEARADIIHRRATTWGGREFVMEQK